jgi:FLVCR family MFS transporter
MDRFGTYPLFFELSIETTFPIPEGVTAGALTMCQAAVQAVFLAIPVDVVGTKWMNWALMICPIVFAVVLLMFRDEYARLNMDLASGPVSTATDKQNMSLQHSQL